MKKLVVATSIAVAALGVRAECKIVSYTHGALKEAIHAKGWQFPKYDEVCKKLSKANATVAVQWDATVLSGVSAAWVSVFATGGVSDLSTTDESRSTTVVDATIASQDHADELAYSALMNAMNGWEVDKAIAKLNEARKKMH